ncbi:MAG TPA: glycosyltransferase family 39 protein, partial [Anaerolineae bacterium]
MSLKNRIWLLVALVVAFGMRVYRLDAQSLWNDEGTSIALAALNVNAIAGGAARDIHPPLYYLLLHCWMPFAGLSEFGVRFLSVLAGTLVVALTYRLAHDFFDL